MQKVKEFAKKHAKKIGGALAIIALVVIIIKFRKGRKKSPFAKKR